MLNIYHFSIYRIIYTYNNDYHFNSFHPLFIIKRTSMDSSKKGIKFPIRIEDAPRI